MRKQLAHTFKHTLIKTNLGRQIKHDPSLQFYGYLIKRQLFVFCCNLVPSPPLFPRQPIMLRVFKAAEFVDQWECSFTRKPLCLVLCFLFSRPTRQRSFNEATVLYLSWSSASMDSCFLIVLFVFAFSLSNGERTLKFVTVVSIMCLSRLLSVCADCSSWEKNIQILTYYYVCHIFMHNERVSWVWMWNEFLFVQRCFYYICVDTGLFCISLVWYCVQKQRHTSADMSNQFLLPNLSLVLTACSVFGFFTWWDMLSISFLPLILEIFLLISNLWSFITKLQFPWLLKAI